jgi:hypothetical protein
MANSEDELTVATSWSSDLSHRSNRNLCVCSLPPCATRSPSVTSHSSQGATANRVLVYVDTEQAHEQLSNSRLGSVSVSRGRYDAQIYTNDTGKLGEKLSHDVSNQSALETRYEMSSRDQAPTTENTEHKSVGESHGHGGSIQRLEIKIPPGTSQPRFFANMLPISGDPAKIAGESQGREAATSPAEWT